MAQVQLAADPKGDLINALDGDWPATEKAVADKLRAKAEEGGQSGAERPTTLPGDARFRPRVMMIRAYRMRGHIYANLDPLGLEQQRDHEELHPSTYGFQGIRLRPQVSSSTMCSGSNSRPCAKCLRSCGGPIAGPSVSNSSIFLIRRREAWIQERVEGPDKEIQFTREGKRAILGT